MAGLIIGLAGGRGVGKSRIADHLVEAHGFQRIHPFQGGKAACIGYFVHVGATPEEAVRMVNGDLKDQPSPFLPDNQTPRYYMERFGQFMGVQMGPAWTIGQEIRLALEKNPDARLIAESIVYEVGVIRQMGGVIVKVTRDGANIAGLETDKVTATIEPDILFANNGTDLEELPEAVDWLLDQIMDHLEPEDDLEPCV